MQSDDLDWLNAWLSQDEAALLDVLAPGTDLASMWYQKVIMPRESAQGHELGSLASDRFVCPEEVEEELARLLNPDRPDYLDVKDFEHVKIFHEAYYETTLMEFRTFPELMKSIDTDIRKGPASRRVVYLLLVGG